MTNQDTLKMIDALLENAQLDVILLMRNTFKPYETLTDDEEEIVKKLDESIELLLKEIILPS